MGSGGGKGGQQSTQVKIPAWLEDAAKQNIARADVLSTIGYTPYYGPDVAAMTPQEIAAMQGTNQAASAFGMPTSDPMAGMPQATNYGGMQAYSSGSLYDQALAELAAKRPGQYAAMTAPFIDPVTGAAPQAPFGPLVSGSSRSSTTPVRTSPTQGSSGSSGGSSGGSYSAARPTSGGYTSIRDMFDGGGPRTPGSTFSGGPMSGSLNRIGVKPAGSSGSSGMGGGK